MSPQVHLDMSTSAPPDQSQTFGAYAARAQRLEAAANATVFVAPLTSKQALREYSSRLADLQFLIKMAEEDSLDQLPPSRGRLHMEPSLHRAKDALASGMIMKGNAQLAMKDYDGAIKTLREVMATIAPDMYGELVRQAEFALQNAEKAATAAGRPTN